MFIIIIDTINKQPRMGLVCLFAPISIFRDYRPLETGIINGKMTLRLRSGQEIDSEGSA